MSSVLSKKIKNNKLFIFILIAITAVILIALASNLMEGDEAVEYRILSEAEVPQDISTQIIPEYRDLERALACVVEDKIYVLVTRGEKPTSGYEIAIEKMELSTEDGSENLIVYANFKDPQPDTSLSQVLTYPLQIAETGLSELPDSIELRVQY